VVVATAAGAAARLAYGAETTEGHGQALAKKRGAFLGGTSL
jgi:hypothetical protein